MQSQSAPYRTTKILQNSNFDYLPAQAESLFCCWKVDSPGANLLCISAKIRPEKFAERRILLYLKCTLPVKHLRRADVKLPRKKVHVNNGNIRR